MKQRSIIERWANDPAPCGAPPGREKQRPGQKTPAQLMKERQDAQRELEERKQQNQD